MQLAEAVARIGRKDWPIRLTDTTRSLVDELGRILGLDPKQVGEDAVVLASGTASGFILATLRTTTNPTVLEAGYKHNVIPDTATRARRHPHAARARRRRCSPSSAS